MELQEFYRRGPSPALRLEPLSDEETIVKMNFYSSQMWRIQKTSYHLIESSLNHLRSEGFPLRLEACEPPMADLCQSRVSFLHALMNGCLRRLQQTNPSQPVDSGAIEDKESIR
jgi:hypothetical protein